MPRYMCPVLQQHCEQLVSDCNEGSYGVNCAETCGHCSGLCDGVDGGCAGGCEQWYGLSQCKEEIGKFAILLGVLIV